MRLRAGKSLATAGVLAVVAGSVAAVALSTVSSPMASAAKDPVGQAVAAADRAVASGLDALRKGPSEQFDRTAVHKGGAAGKQDLYYVGYNKTYRGLEVVGGDAVVITNATGGVLDTVAGHSGAISVSTAPGLAADKAAAAARGAFTKVDAVGTPKLVVLSVKQPQPILAWEVEAAGTPVGDGHEGHGHGASGIVQKVYIDAQSAKIAHTAEQTASGTGTGIWNGANLTIGTTQSGSSYRMADPNRPNLNCQDFANNTVFTDADDVWGSTSKTDKVSGCVDVMYAGAGMWDVLKNWYGRNGLDGNGNWADAEVGLQEQNAYWGHSNNTDGVVFGYNNNQHYITGIDVVAHEYGHGFDAKTPGGISGHPSQESVGDIWGAITEHYLNNPNDAPDYEVGEEINLQGNGPIRYMYKPSTISGHPDCYSSSLPSSVHAAAGPMNHWFYLLAEGSAPGNGKPNSPICSGGPSSVTGIGIQDAGKIFYNAMLSKTSGMTYQKWRLNTVTAAKNLDSTGNLCNKVKAAWLAVAMPAQSGEATCPTGTSDWSIALSPPSGSVQPGNSVTSTVTLTATGTAQNVALSASGQPSGVTVSFNPTTISSNGGTSTMTVAASSSAASGSASITVAGDGTTDHSATFNLTVGTPPTGQIPDIDVAKVKAHLSQFATIASNNGGNRRSTGAGYTASVAYVKGKLQTAGFTVTEQPCTSGCTSGSGPNLIAEWPGGDANTVYMFGAHLDSVSAGPGINDNASGSASLLETALVLAQQNPTMLNKVRFGWWTDEEQGLNGSKFYVAQLSSTERSKIKAYYNFDMIGSTNGGYFINNITTTQSAPMKAYWDSLNLSPEENTEGAGRSDDASFKNAGIPSSGYATGASARKTTAQANKWGGTANSAYDPCYHQSCDTTNNISDTHLNRSADGIAYTLWKQAVGTAANDYSITTDPNSGSVERGSSVTTTVKTAITSGSAQTVALSASGQPSGVTVSFSPTSVQSGANSTMTVAASASAATGTYTITVNGDGTADHSTTYSLTVTGGGSTPSPTPSATPSATPSSTPTTQPGRTFTNGTDYQIADNRITSPVTSNAPGQAVSPVKVSITIQHTCAEDLGISLIAPNGQIYAVKYSGSGNYPCTPFGGTKTYNVPVSSAATGTWQLRVTDYGPGDVGVLDTWSITL